MGARVEMQNQNPKFKGRSINHNGLGEMFCKLADTVILQQANADLLDRRKLLTEQRSNALSELRERQVPEPRGKRSERHPSRAKASSHP